MMESYEKRTDKEQQGKKFSKIANEKYTIIDKIGQGSFGEVYVCVFIKSEKQTFRSVKTEDEKTRTPQLLNEAKLLKYLNPKNNILGFPQLFEFGNQNGLNYMVTELLGPTLNDLFLMCGSKFTLKTTLMIGMQIIDRLQELHNKHYLFRDIKPQNFLVGLHDNSHVVYIIDFGLSKKYRDPRTLIHIPYKEDKNITGTIRYTSLNSHLGIQQSRRDDLQALAYMLIYFMKGALPWQGIKGNSKKEKQYKIMEKKMMIPAEALTKALPIEFSNFLNYVKTLRFEQKPDYQFLKNELRSIFYEQGFVEDFEYDWCCLPQNPKQMENSLIKIRINNKITIQNDAAQQPMFEPESEKKKEMPAQSESQNNKDPYVKQTLHRKKYPISNEENLKDVQPGQSPLELTFEVMKKLEDKQQGLKCRICDETGASDAIFHNPIKKYIEEGQVYTARFAVAEVVNEHIRIELNKEKGSITKEPTIIPFKDNTFDLSKKEWFKLPKKTGDADQFTDQKQKAKQAELEHANKLKSSSKISKEPKVDLNKSQRDNFDSDNKNRRQNDNGNQKGSQVRHKMSDKDNYHEDYQESRKGDQKKRVYTEINKKNEERSPSNSKPKVLNKLTDLINIRSGDFVSFKAYVSEGSFNWKDTKNGEKKFFECDLTDSSGTVFGSFFEKARLTNNNYYDFECLKVRVTTKAFELQETIESSYKLNDNLNFKRNFKLIEP